MPLAIVCALVLSVALPLHVQQVSSTADPLHRSFDQTLDLYVRDGFVYYGALKAERGRLDRYLADLNGPAAIEHATGTRGQQLAFWLNAYNAFVLRTVLNNYPIRGKASMYPADSIRQIPGAFERVTHRAAGRTVTLDAIEKEILDAFGDARVFLALGRGAVGGGRLRSEAYDGAKLEAQLSAVAAEAVNRKEVVRIDTVANQLVVSPLFSWREAAFVGALAERAPAAFEQRSPLERAVLALIEPHLVGSEAEFLDRNQFSMTFSEFDWRLNDLGTRGHD